jgi:HSP20 family protein
MVMALRKRESTSLEPLDVFSRLDRMFDEWARSWPFHGAVEARWPRLMPDDVIRVDEFKEDSTLVVRAEIAGIDPDKDVTLTVDNGMLRIAAERRSEETDEDKGYLRRELHYGSFSRTLSLPEGVSESDITASYKDGILEIRVPIPEPPAAPEPKRIPVAKG